MALAKTGGVQDVLALLGAVKGTSQTSSTRNTVSAAGVQELIDQMLRSNQGLAAVASGQKGAGVYNSSTNRLMTNDLLTSAAAKAELARAGTTTTQRVAPQFGIKDLLTLQGLGKLKGTAGKLGTAFDSALLGDVNMFGQTEAAWSGAGSTLGQSLGFESSLPAIASEFGGTTAAAAGLDAGFGAGIAGWEAAGAGLGSSLSSGLGLSGAGTAATAGTAGAGGSAYLAGAGPFALAALATYYIGKELTGGTFNMSNIMDKMTARLKGD